MKKRVRVYKAESGKGEYINPTAKFLRKAQMGAQQQETDPQQLVGQVAMMVAPPPYGDGQDPNQVYATLAQSYGEEAAAQIINAAAAYVQQMVQENEGQSQGAQMQEAENPDLNYQEELIRQEQARQEQMQNEQAAAEDEVFYDNLLFGEPDQQGEEMKLGGIHKKFVSHTMKLAKKALGDAGTSNPQSGKADSTDILNGRAQKNNDFLTSIQNQSTLATIKKQAENIAKTIFTPENTFQEMGGFTGGDLYKFVYGGGDDPSIARLSKAQDGTQTGDKRAEYQAWFDRMYGQPTQEGYSRQTPVSYEQWMKDYYPDATAPTDKNKTLYNVMKNSGLNVGDYREGIDYSRLQNSMNNPGNPSTNGSLWDILTPGNGIFNTTYTMSGQNLQGLNPKDLMKQGFNMEKERLGFGHKRYTFTPVGSEQVTAQNKNNADGSGIFNKDQYGHNKLYYDAQRIGQNIGDAFRGDGNFGSDIKSFMSKVFTNPQKQAAYGLQTYQGNINGSSVNNQEPMPEFKPRTSKEVWATTEPQIREAWGLENQEPEIEQGTPKLEVDEKKKLNGRNLMRLGIGTSQLLTKAKNIWDKRFDRQDELNSSSSPNQVTARDNEFTGNYDANSGLIDNMGQRWFSRDGGEHNFMRQGGRTKTGQQLNGALAIQPTAMGGSDINQYMGMKQPEVKDTLGPVSREEANLEAEKGETAYGDINGDGFAEHYKIGGKRHSQGGTPLNLPDDTFIFSDTRSMKLNDPALLKMFNKPTKKGGYTPAELAKPYDVNKYRKILEDPDSDIIDRKTAEQMIKNFTIKLGALALAQESKKAFPQGIPVVARPYMEMMGLKDEDILPQEAESQNPAMMQQGMMSGEEQAEQEASPEEMAMMQQSAAGMPPVDQMAMSQEDMSGAPMAAYGMQMGGFDMPFADYMYAMGGALDRYQTAGEVNYDVKDKNLRPDVENYVNEKGVKIPYTFVDPADEFRYDQENVGQQTKKTGYEVDPESGFYYNPKTGKKPGKAGLEDFYRRHKDFIDLYEGKYGKGKDAWIKEQVEAKGKPNPAMTFVVNNLNALHKKLTGKEMVDIKQKGAYVPGVELFNLPGLQLKAKEKEEVKKTVEEEKAKEIEKEQEYIDQIPPMAPYQGDAPWWLQDQLKVAGAFGDLMGVNKYYPWAPKYNPEIPNVRFLDPTRNIAAQSEQAKILGDAMAQFSPSANLAAGRLSGIQGQLAKGVADVQNQYDTNNVQIANTFEPAISDIYNKAQLYNQGVSKELYNGNTIMNQQYDNTMRALKNNLLNYEVNGITNAMKTDAMNQMYPQFRVDPSVGGKLYHTGQQKSFRPEASTSLNDLYEKYYNATGDKDVAMKFAMLEYKQGDNSSDMYPTEAMMSLYGNMKDGGMFVLGPSMLPPFIM